MTRPPKNSGAPSLGAFTAGQLVRLCDVAGLSASDAEIYARILLEMLGPVADRPLSLPPPSASFLSDDHTPVEFSLAFLPGAPPALRVLLEPGADAADPAEGGRAGLLAVRAMARRWNFGTDRLDELEDLFFPSSPHGPFTLWCALELRPGGVPKVKVYLNPAASGRNRAAETVREALRRIGHRRAFAVLPQADGYPFFALDLGDWDEPRAKVYLRHDHLTAARAADLSRMRPGPDGRAVREFFQDVSGYADVTAPLGAGPLRAGRPGLTCHAFTDRAARTPTGFTLHIPVRDYVRHDRDALSRATTVLRRRGMEPTALRRALSAVTSRDPRDGVGLVAYLALAHQQGRPPRVTAYVSSEAYRVRPPVPATRERVPAVG
ncbi:tryptophan dimethylallyltransferase family protein [Streptomyces sp. NPDC002265]|uniref:tryptophan dimethylallyltransferase family protein n=1 Tax=Streptomyces sp. NPDC002265 TaxID=3154415 RepID=UPI00332B43E3